MTAPPAPHRRLAFPLTHLWFLYVLVLLYSAVMAIRPAFDRAIDPKGIVRDLIDRVMRGLVSSGLAPVVLALPLFVVLARDPEWRRWFGIPTPDQSLIPNLPAATAFVVAFLFGWLLHRQTGLAEGLAATVAAPLRGRHRHDARVPVDRRHRA